MLNRLATSNTSKLPPPFSLLRCDDRMLLFSMSIASHKIASIACSNHSTQNLLPISNASKLLPTLPLVRARVTLSDIALPEVSCRIDWCYFRIVEINSTSTYFITTK